MSEEPLRLMLTEAVAVLRSGTELTMNEVIGISALPEAQRTPEVCYALGVLHGASTALRATRREMLQDLDLLIAAPQA